MTDLHAVDTAFDPSPSTFRRRDALGLLGIAVGATLGMPAFAQTAPRKGGILKIANPANPSSLDPATGGAGTDHPVLWTLYDTLVEWDYATLKPKPGMADWTFSDATTMVLDLKPGIRFHDGTPCDAEAVKWNLDRNRSDAASNLKADLASITATAVTGPTQVKITLGQPDAALPAILSDRSGMMVSPTAQKAAGKVIIDLKFETPDVCRFRADPRYGRRQTFIAVHSIHQLLLP